VAVVSSTFPCMTRFNGTINLDSSDSVPDWEPYLQPVAPEGAPNIGYLVLVNGEPVTDDYPGGRPYAFRGGVIRRAIVDVSGEPFIDLEREAAMMMRRE